MRFEDGAAIVRERSAGLCERCRRVGIQTHHRRPRGMGGISGVGLAGNLPSNLIRLCLDCHRWIESERELAEKLGLLILHDEREPADIPVWLDHVNGRGYWSLLDDGNMVYAEDQPVPSREETASPSAWPAPVGKASSRPGTYVLL